MNSTQSNHRVPTEPGFRDAGLDELVKDVSRLGPAPNRSREAFSAIVNLAVVGAGLAVIRPEPAVAVGIAAAAVAYVAIRWAAGIRKWGAR